MRKIVLFLFGVFATLGCFGQSPLGLLDKAYHNRSHKQLEAFFQDWRQQLPINEPQDNDTIQCFYKVFNSFYNPMELEVIEFHFPHITVVKQRKDGSIVERYYFQKKYKRYANTRYFMVQDQLTVYMVDTIDCVDTQNVSVPYNFYWCQNWFDNAYKIIRKIEISDFRPKTQFPDKVLYLTPDYKKTLYEFLEADTSHCSTEKVSTDKQSRIKSKKKFLKNYVSPIYYKYRNVWLLSTWPVVDYMITDAQWEYIVVCFRKYTNGGYALYHRKGEQWELVETNFTRNIDY